MALQFRMLGILVLSLLFSFCSSPRYLAVDKVSQDQAVKVYLSDGSVYRGIVIENTGQEMTIVSADDHQTYQVAFTQIRRIERLNTYFDYQGYPISEAEIAKYKTSRNTWGHAIGGAVIGGLVGLSVGIPIWLANDNPPPLFVGGLGVIVGSIFFGARGVKRDHQVAVETVRAVRFRDSELQAEKQNEERRLKELQKEKQKLLKKLEEKKKQKESDSEREHKSGE